VPDQLAVSGDLPAAYIPDPKVMYPSPADMISREAPRVIPVFKGVCVVCGSPVLDTQERDKDEAGGYHHTNPADCSGIAATTV
jgi:hypothetical protein